MNSIRGKFLAAGSAALVATSRRPNAYARQLTRHRFCGATAHSHDLQAALMHLSGRGHTHLTYRFRCRDIRLTGALGVVAKGVLD